ncbi:MAG: tyrosine-type recombinase/integrase [bacterium]|nr:tyrosine-type recombinase/integrase [bacterium]
MGATKRRQHGDGSLFQRADGTWVATLELPPDGNGKRRRWVGKAQTQAKALEKLRGARKDRDNTGTVGPRRLTVGQWLDQWLQSIARENVRPKTYREYERCVRLHLKPALGRIPLWTLRPDQLRAALATMAETKTPATARNSHRCLRTALSAAERDGLVTRNVAKLVPAPKSAPVERPALSAMSSKALVGQDLDGMERWAFAVGTGARQGEALGLTWDRLDLEAGTVDISWQLQRLIYDHGCGPRSGDVWPCEKVRAGYCPSKRLHAPADFEVEHITGGLFLTRPKTNAGQRVVPLLPSLAELLRAHRRAQGLRSRFVWSREDGRPVDPKDDHQAWKDALESAGLPAVPLHSARHTMVTLLMESGADPRVVKELVGHSSVAIGDAYRHVSLDLARKAIDGLGAQLA